MSAEIYPGERIDDLQRNHYRIIQNPDQFCFGIDAVLLSGFVTLRRGETLLDLGTGTGILPILLAAKTEGKHFTGLEIQAEMAEMAGRSVRLNGLSDRIRILEGDLRKASGLFGKASFDVVISNPPYMNQNHGLTNPKDVKAIARHELCCTLEDVIREAAAVVKPGGRFYMVHRPHRLADIFVCMRKYRLEPKRLRFVYPFADAEPNMVLIEGVRGGRPWLKADPPLVVYRAPGIYTDEVLEIYGREEAPEAENPRSGEKAPEAGSPRSGEETPEG